MSNSGLSNHLCIVVAIISSLLVPFSMFQPVCATNDSHDFSQSRQFKKNLAVSKYRNNTHWLPNYTWTPPEKIDGPRKKPAWEMDKVSESEAEKKERIEREEWENKMREVTRREREKWNSDETNDLSRSNSTDQLSTPPANILKHTTGNTDSMTSSAPKLKISREGSIGLTSNLHNGRWGMSVVNSADEGTFEDTSKTLDPVSANSAHEETTLSVNFPSGRWGMSVKKAPKEFVREMSVRSKVDRSRDSLNRYDEETTEKEWGNDKESIASKSLGTTADSSVEQSIAVEHSNHSSSYEKKPTILTTFSNGRWGIDVKEPPKEFLQEMSRRSQTWKKPNEMWKPVEDRAHARHRKIHGDKEDREKKNKMMIGQAITNLSKVLSRNRWGMSVNSPPREFLREISKNGHAGTVKFYEPKNSDQLLGSRVPKNNPRTRELIFLRSPTIANVLFLQSVPRIFGLPILPKYSINSRIWKTLMDHNTPRIRCVVCAS